MVPSRVEIEVLGTFDEAAARAVRSALARGVESIMIDFTRASRVDPTSLAILARELTRNRGGTVAIEGLSRHQERLLRYLGARLGKPPTPGPVAKA